MEKTIARMQLELKIIKRALNWYEQCKSQYGQPRVSVSIKDEGVRSVLSTPGDYDEYIYPLTPEEVKILLAGE